MQWTDLILRFGPRTAIADGEPKSWRLQAELQGRREEGVFHEPFEARQWRAAERAGGRGALPRGGFFEGDRGSVEQGARTLGEKLFEAVFTGCVAKLWERADEIRGREREGLRIIIDLVHGDARELNEHRWELIALPRQRRFVAREKNTAVVRRLRARAGPEVPKTFRLMVVYGGASDAVAYGAPDDEAVVAQRLMEEEARLLQGLSLPSFDVQVKQIARRRDLYDVLSSFAEDEIHGLHFVGHGSYDAAWDLGFLLLGDGEGRIEDADLAQLLQRIPSLRFVFLNLCSAARTFEGGGLAAQLSQVGISNVVAAGRPVGSIGAKSFAIDLYRHLARGRLLVEALGEARLGLGREGGHPLEWSAFQAFESGEALPLVQAQDVEPEDRSPDRGLADRRLPGHENAPTVHDVGSLPRRDGESQRPPQGLAGVRGKAVLVLLAAALLLVYLLPYAGSWPPRPGVQTVPTLSLIPDLTSKPSEGSNETDAPVDASAEAPARNLENNPDVYPSFLSASSEALRERRLELSVERTKTLWGGTLILSREQSDDRRLLGLTLRLPGRRVFKTPIHGLGDPSLDGSPWQVFVEQQDVEAGTATVIVTAPVAKSPVP